MRKKLLRENKKLIRRIKKLIQEKSKSAQTNLNLKTQTILKTLETAQQIIEQQTTLIKQKSKSIKERIISFHEPKARPIVRGKEGKKVEFGSKIALSVLGGGIAVSHNFSSENFSDTEMIDSGLDIYQEIRGKPPKEVIADRGAHSPKNHNFLQENKITDGIEYRGKPPSKAKLPTKTKRNRMRKQRSVVEGKIGTYKMMGNRCKYAFKNTQTWISFGLIAMNARWAISKV